MIRRPFPLLVPLALATLGACQDLPTNVLAPEAASFVQAPSGPVVNSLLDDGTGCTENKCTLRDAIAFASSGATITFSVNGTIQLLSGSLRIREGLRIAGPGAEQLTIRGSGSGEVIDVSSDYPVTISGLTLTGGQGSSMVGGGMTVYDTHLTVENSVITGNTGGFGGGIAHWGSSGSSTPPHRALVVRNTTVSNNTAVLDGGGIFSAAKGGTVIENSTVSGNRSERRDGGGIHVVAGLDLRLINSTVSENTAGHDGGGVFVWGAGSSSITHSTIWGNSAPHGGGIWIGHERDLTVRNTIIANSAAGGDCAFGGALHGASGYNLVQDGSCISSDPTSMSGDPLLGPLADNGGPTRTHALLTGSPAIDAIPFGSNSCGISTDQRGFPRPQPSGGNCDIGAFEVQPPTITLSINGNGTLTNKTGAATITGTLICSAPASVPLSVSLTQQQTRGKSTTTVAGSGSTTVSCSGTTAWSVTVTPASGKFAAGAAVAEVSATGASTVTQTVQLR